MRKNYHVILDRDGTLIRHVHHLTKIEQIDLLPNASEGLKLLKQSKLGLVVITNQSVIGRGLISHDQLRKIHMHLVKLLGEQIEIDHFYYCPHLPNDSCLCRKPEIELVFKASQDLKFDPADTFVIGDQPSDIQLGQKIGATTFLVTSQKDIHPFLECHPDFVVDDILEAANIIQYIVGAMRQTHFDQQIRSHLLANAEIHKRAIDDCLSDISSAAEELCSCLRANKKIIICGNGGGAALSQHLASEFVNLLNRNSPRKALPAIALSSDSALITSIANDMGYDSVFERQIDALGQAGDALIAISGSGTSVNIIRAITRAKDKGLSTIGLTGNLSLEFRDLVDIVICAPSSTTSHIQELHLTIGHILCAIVEQEIFDIRR